MNDRNFWRLLVGVGVGLFIVGQISRQPSDIRGTLVQDLVTGYLYWI